MPGNPLPDAVGLPHGAVTLVGHASWVNRIVPLPDGESIATVRQDKSVCIFAANGAPLRTLTGHTWALYGLAALGGDAIVTGDCGGDVRVWRASTGECLHSGQLGGSVLAIAALGAGSFVAGAGCDLVLLAHSGGRNVSVVRRITDAHAGTIRDIAVSGARIATASYDSTAVVWDARSLSRLAVLKGHTGVLFGVAIDERYISTASQDHRVRVYDAQTFAFVHALARVHTKGVRSVEFLAGSHVLSASADETVCVSHVATGALVARVRLPFEVFCAAITRDGRLAAAGRRGNAVVFPAPAPAAALIRAHADAVSGAFAVTDPIIHLQGVQVDGRNGAQSLSGASLGSGLAVRPPTLQASPPRPPTALQPPSDRQAPPTPTSPAPPPRHQSQAHSASLPANLERKSQLQPSTSTSSGRCLTVPQASRSTDSSFGQSSGSLVGGLLTCPLDGGASIVMSGIVLVLAGVQKVAVMLRLMKESNVAALALADRVEHLSGALRDQAKAPDRVTPTWYNALARMASQLDMIEEYVGGVLSQEKRARLRDQLQRFWRATDVAAQLAAHRQALSDLAVDLNFVIGADGLAVIHGGVQQLREGLSEVHAGIGDIHGDVRKLTEIVTSFVVECRQGESGAIQSALHSFGTDPGSPVSTEEGGDAGDVNCEDVAVKRETLRPAVDRLRESLALSLPGLPDEAREEALAKLECAWEPWRLDAQDLGDKSEWKRIGKGAIGVVYKTTLRLKSGETIPVAVKSFENWRQERGQFEREAAIMRDCNHPCVLRAHGALWPLGCGDSEDSGSSSDEGGSDAKQGGAASGGAALLVVELMKRNLGDALRKSHIVDVAAKLDVLLDVANGLAHLHGRRIAHLDLKPENVLLNLDSEKGCEGLKYYRVRGHAKISDFGMSRQKREESRTHVLSIVAGTMAYMAPEQFQSVVHARVQSDMWSFGVMMLGVLSSVPVEKLSDFERTLAVVETRLSAHFEDAIAGLPNEGLTLIVRRCLVDKWEDRASALQIANALRAAVNFESQENISLALGTGL
jgi:WD40 repeat protein